MQHAKVERFVENGEVRVCIHGRLDLESAPTVLDWLQTWLPKESNQIVRLDLGEVDYLDSSGVAVLSESYQLASARGCQIQLVRVSEAARKSLELFWVPTTNELMEKPAEGLVERLGGTMSEQLEKAKKMLLLISEVFYWSLWGPFTSIGGAPKGETIRQTILLGSRAFGIVALLASLIGLTLALLSAHQLRQFGANIYVANLVAVAMAREMGPVMTAVIVAGRSGSAIAAEIATMKVTEEVDALQAMGFSPLRYLVVPKFYAVTVTQPLLTIVSVAFGILGGMVIGAIALGVPPVAFLHQAGAVLRFKDIGTGLLKSEVFGWIILLVSAHAGLSTRGGAEAVGFSTTRSVVVSIFSVIVADCIFSLFFYA